MHPDTHKSGDCEELVDVEEDFIVRVSENGGRDQKGECDSTCTDYTSLDEGLLDRHTNDMPSFDVNGVDKPDQAMCHGFEHNRPTNPSVDKVVLVKGDTEHPDKWIVASSEEE